MTNIKTTQLNGLVKQLEQIQGDLHQIEGFVEEDTNPFFEAFAHISNAVDELYYAIKEAKDE